MDRAPLPRAGIRAVEAAAGRLNRPGVWALLGYLVASVALTWPLPRHLSTALTGPVSGDTGVYVWNVWLFRHEITAHHRFPYFTGEIFSLTPAANLSLHNYTPFADLLAFPLIQVFGVVASFNLVYLATTILSAWMMFALARRVCGSAAEAWLAGLLFAWSPALVARSEAHFSLVAAAPLPAFALALIRWQHRQRLVDACLVGLTVAWAAMCDPYYGVYCVLFGACALSLSVMRVRLGERPEPRRPVAFALVDGLLLVLGCVAAAIAWSGGFRLRVIGFDVKAYSLYTPMLVLTVLALIRVAMQWPPRLVLTGTRLQPSRVVKGAAAALFCCALVLSPFFVALAVRLARDGGFPQTVLWRSSPPGLDLLALFMPNPNHPLIGGIWRNWAIYQPGGFVENVASLSFAGMGVIALATWRYGFRPSAPWMHTTALFGALALGPFIRIGGFNTYVPGPWALLRYVPLAGAARMPARFAAPMMMGLAVVFAGSLARVCRQHPRRRRVVLIGVGLALAFELNPAPRKLYSATAPEVYRVIARDPGRFRVLELPFGIRDGESSLGNFSAASQFYQTFHEKPLIGGYLSRVGRRDVQRQLNFWTLRGLLKLSEGQALTAQERQMLVARAPRFADRARVGYVVIDETRAPPALRQFALEAFHLVRIGESEGHALYRVPALPLAKADAVEFIPPLAAVEPLDR